MSSPETTACPAPSSNEKLPPGAANPFVFMVGSPRSGTTMLKRMVAAHPLMAVTRETHWIPGIFERRRGLTDRGRVTTKVVEKLRSHKRFEQIKTPPETVVRWIADEPQLSYAELVSRLFDRYGERKGKPLVGDKTPTYVRNIPTLHQLWPRAKFVHLIRDGRDVCLSMLKWRKADKAAGQFATWADDPVVTTALWWKALVGLGVEEGRRLPDGLHAELKYEHLVANPAGACRQLTEFLGLDYDPAMENYHEGRTQFEAGLSANAAWLPPTPGRRDWRRDMAAADVARFEAATGDLLDLLGYERACHDLPADARRAADDIRARFAAEARERNWRLPELW
ncbi:MAG: hypothetical protein CMJ58_13980 [Planctomycetaceae bacterium]|nr:hypothetical protein [Planctomycetaceae bacterium]